MVVGWDIGGAHVKAALFAEGAVRDAAQWPCPLWQGQAHLAAALNAARSRWPQIAKAAHAVTMTGEMVDLFEDREAGVRAIAVQVASAFGGRLQFFGGIESSRPRWFGAAQAGAQWRAIASANWAATAAWIGCKLRNAVLVDIGSTTTDIIAIDGAQPAAYDRDDAERLARGELVYGGVVRTPLACLAQRVPFRGREFNVMNELFATTSDVYRLTAELDPAHDQHAAADNGAKDLAASCRRLARMIGHDARDARRADWIDLARHWRAAQLAQIRANFRRVVSRSAVDVCGVAPVVAAGCGAFLARDLAARESRPWVGFDELTGVAGSERSSWISVCAPSVAVALLAAAEPERALGLRMV
jgi:probable H4MPT-linked C1 transfer pathway protein